MRNPPESCAVPETFDGANSSPMDLAKKLAKGFGIVWLACAVLTWTLCPSPAPLHPYQPAKYADEVGYLVECLSLWPAIAYFVLEHPGP